MASYTTTIVQDDREACRVLETVVTTLYTPQVSFSDLPTELRLMIWKSAIPLSRVLRLGFGADPNDRQHPQVMGSRTLPTILHICQESRKVALTILQLGFGAGRTEKDQTWWNPSIDVLYLPPWQPPVVWDPRGFFNFQETFQNPYLDAQRNNSSGIGNPCYHDALHAVQHLALPYDFMVLSAIKYSLTNGAWLLNWLRGFKKLKSLTLVIERYPRMHAPEDIQLGKPGGSPINDPASTAGMYLNTPYNIEQTVAQKLADYKTHRATNWEVPVVSIKEARTGMLR